MILLLALVLLAAPGWAGLPPAADTGEFGRRSDGQGFWRAYDARDGLGSDVALCVFQDVGGYLWVGTDSGVSRFDGQHFSRFGTADGLGDGPVIAITQDDAGALWFASDGGGISRYDGSGFTRFSADDAALSWRHEDTLAGDDVNFIFTDSAGALWFGTTTGVSRHDDDEFTTFTSEYGLVGDDVLCMAEDGRGHFWFGSRTGVSRYDGQLFRGYDKDDSLAGPIHFIHEDAGGALWFGTDHGVSRYEADAFQHFEIGELGVLAVGQSADGVLWFGTRDGVVYRHAEGRWESFSPSAGSAVPVVEILADDEGHIWFGHDGDGLSRFDGDGWTSFPTGWSGRGAGHGQILQDREGVIWAATTDGLYRYDGATWTVFGEAHGLAGHIAAIGRGGDGLLWSVSDSDVRRFSGGRWLRLPNLPAAAGRFRSVLAEDDRTWIAGDGILCRQDTGWTCFDAGSAPSGIAGPVFADLRTGFGFADGQGRLWWATQRGLLRFDDEQWRLLTTADGLVDDEVHTVFGSPGGGLWVGTDGGLQNYTDNRWTTYSAADGLPHDRVLAGVVDVEGIVWVGTPGGLGRFDGSDWRAFGAPDGLAQNRVISLALGADGHIWAGTERSGVSRFDGRVFQTYDPRDGLAGGHVSSIHAGDGVYWFVTDGGLTRFAPRQPPAAPVVHLDAAIADRRYLPPAALSLPSDLGLLAFEFHGLSFKTRAGAIRYRYRLRGWQDWQLTAARIVRFESVPVGEYVFEVEALDRDLVASPVTSWDLRVHPPRERLRWMAAVAIVMLLALGQSVRLGLFRRRLRREGVAEIATAREQQLCLLSEERGELAGHDVLGRCLVAPVPTGAVYLYFPRPGGLRIACIDVAGDGPALSSLRVTVGVLYNEMDRGADLTESLAGLRRSLRKVMPDPVAVMLLDVEAATGRVHMADHAWPTPVIWRQRTGDVATTATDLVLDEGDSLLICNHGVLQETDPGGSPFSSAVLEAFADGSRQGMKTEQLLRHLFGALFLFPGSGAQRADHLMVLVTRNPVASEPLVLQRTGGRPPP